MSSKRLTKKCKVVGTKVCAPSSAGEVRTSGVIQACKNDPAGSNVYTIMLDDGSLREYAEEEIFCIDVKASGKGKSRYNQKMLLNCKGGESALQEREGNDVPLRSPEPRGLTARRAEDRYLENKCNRTHQVENEPAIRPLGSVSEHKRLLTSASIDVPQRFEVTSRPPSLPQKKVKTCLSLELIRMPEEKESGVQTLTLLGICICHKILHVANACWCHPSWRSNKKWQRSTSA